MLWLQKLLIYWWQVCDLSCCCCWAKQTQVLAETPEKKVCSSSVGLCVLLPTCWTCYTDLDANICPQEEKEEANRASAAGRRRKTIKPQINSQEVPDETWRKVKTSISTCVKVFIKPGSWWKLRGGGRFLFQPDDPTWDRPAGFSVSRSWRQLCRSENLQPKLLSEGKLYL